MNSQKFVAITYSHKSFFGFLSQLSLSAKCGFRNLKRNRWRTVLTLLSIAIGFIGLILLDGYINYAMWGLKETIIHSGTGHFQAALSPEFFDEGESDPFPFLFPDSHQLAKELRRIPEVKEVLPSIAFSSVLNVNGKMQSVQIKALPFDQAGDLLSFLTLEKGQMLNSESTGQILLGKGLASKLGLKIQDKLSLFALSQDGGVNNLSYQIAGVVSTGIAAVDSAFVYMDLPDALALLQTENVPQLIVLLEHTEDTAKVLASIHRQWPKSAPQGAVFRPWDELSAYYKQANNSYQMFLGIARLIVLLVVLFSISCTISLSVLERLREMGTLRAFGTKRKQIVLMFVFEGLFLGILGLLIGSGLGWLLTELINIAGGVTLAAQPGTSKEISILIRPSLENFVSNIFWIMLFSILGAFIPSYLSSRKNTADLLRSV